MTDHILQKGNRTKDWMKAILLIVILLFVGLSAVVFAPKVVVVYVEYELFPGGGIELAGTKPIALQPGSGRRLTARLINSDSGIALTCGTSGQVKRVEEGYITPSWHHYVRVKINGCGIEDYTILHFP